MKKILIILLVLLTLPLSGHHYYVSVTDGNDGDSGLTTALAWATISKVNGFSFSAGDTISFNKGDVWRETLEVPRSGTASLYMLFNSYGAGANPQILGSKATTTWADQGSNKWKTAINFTDPRALYPNYADIVFNTGGTRRFGTWKSGTANLTTEYDWCWVSNYIYVYAASDPAARYTGIEVQQRRFGVSTNDYEYIRFDGVDVYYCADSGFDTNADHGDNTDITGFILENCSVGFIGGVTGNQYGFGVALAYSDLIVRNCSIYNCGRRGISLDIYGSGFTATNALIENCVLYNGYHTTAMDVSVGSGVYSGGWDGIVFRNNLVYEIEGSTPIAASNMIFLQNWDKQLGPAILANVYIYNNVFKFTNGNAIAIEATQSTYVYNNTFYGHNNQRSPCYSFYVDTDARGMKVKNNIFYTLLPSETSATGAGLVTTGITDAQLDADYNLYYRTSNSLRIMLLNGSGYYMNTAFPINKGYEAHGIKGDPVFVSTSDLRLQASSPAIEKATPLAVVTVDYLGNARDATTPDIGAYEYDASPPVDVTSITVTGAGGATTISTEGGTLQLSAAVLPNDATDKTVTWSKTNGTGSGTISASGLVTAVADGTMTARATANDGSGVYDDLELTFSNQSSTTYPTIINTEVIYYSTRSAIMSANVTSDGDGTIIARGFCWGTSPDPSLSGTHTHDGGTTGAFTSTLNWLRGNTHYYFRSYVTNEVGTTYGSKQIDFITPVLTVVLYNGVPIKKGTTKVVYK